MRSPIFYMGNKHKLLPQLLKIFPKDIDTFYDLFGGSGCVTINVEANHKIYNDFNPNVVELVKLFKENEPNELDEYFKDKIKKYGLPQRSEKNREAYKTRVDKYNKLREDYNKSENKQYKDLFLLSCYSINHLIRFNKDNEFNASNGSDSYNEKNYAQIMNFHKKIKDVEVFCDDYKNIDILDGENVFVYVDPPYLNTEAVYNEKRAYGGWNIDNDYELFSLLEDLDQRGINWGFSNVFANRGNENTHLIEWCNKNNWNVYHLTRNYNPFSRGNSNNDEVYICNYGGEQ